MSGLGSHFISMSIFPVGECVLILMLLIVAVRIIMLADVTSLASVNVGGISQRSPCEEYCMNNRA